MPALSHNTGSVSQCREALYLWVAKMALSAKDEKTAKQNLKFSLWGNLMNVPSVRKVFDANSDPREASPSLFFLQKSAAI